MVIVTTCLMSTIVTGTGQKCIDLVCGYLSIRLWLIYLIEASSLYTAYNNCLDVLKTRETNFHNRKRMIHPEHLAKWSAMDDVPRKKGKTIISVHVARYKIGMSGIVDMFENFTESGSRTTNAGKGLQSLVSIRNTGSRHFTTWCDRCCALYQ